MIKTRATWSFSLAAHLGQALIVTAAALIVGCASPDQNPSKPTSNRGYVDFFATASDPVFLHIQRFDQSSGKFKLVYSELEEPRYGVVRLAAVPGTHRFQIGVLNLVTSGQIECEVAVREGMVTPVRLDLIQEGKTLVERKDNQLRATLRGGVRRTPRITGEESAVFRPLLTPLNPEPYQVKERMGYPR